MSAERKKHIIELLNTYHDRERKIALLRYELAHPGKVTKADQIEAMNYGHGSALGHVKGRISNKTLYIALNYEDQSARMNQETISGIARELFQLEQCQRKLAYCIDLLDQRQAAVIRLMFLDKVAPREIAERYGLTYRTIERIKKAAIENLAEMYAYSDKFSG